MQIDIDTVILGNAVFDVASLAVGTDTRVVTRVHDADIRLPSEKLAELEAGLAEADHRETISGPDTFSHLLCHGQLRARIEIFAPCGKASKPRLADLPC
jgi:hypothetical protein